MSIPSMISDQIGKLDKVLTGVETASMRNVGSDINLTLGYTDNDIADEYMIKIINDRPAYFCQNTMLPKIIMIKTPIQDAISFRTQSSWNALAASNFAQGTFSELMQVTGRSLVNKFATRRYWSGSTPIQFRINLLFQAKSNPMTEVYNPLKELQRMVLPYSSNKFSSNAVGRLMGKFFLGPPGPNPFYSEMIAQGLQSFGIAEDWGVNDEGEIIKIIIGKTFEIPRCVMRDVFIEVPPMFQKGGAPVIGKATIDFETYEIVTKEELSDIYLKDNMAWNPKRDTLAKSTSSEILGDYTPQEVGPTNHNAALIWLDQGM